MKYLMTVIALGFIIFMGACGPTIYKSSSFNTSKKNIKKIAILPFNISFDGARLLKSTNIEMINEDQKQASYNIQTYAYKWLLDRQNKFTVAFQDIDNTNRILYQTGIRFDSITLTDKSTLCNLLGVDGIITGRVMLSQPLTENTALLKEAISTVGNIVTGSSTFGITSSNTNMATTSITIHNEAGDLLWKYDHAAKGELGSSPFTLTDDLMDNVAQKFPFKK
jgi:hypothetical protein